MNLVDYDRATFSLALIDFDLFIESLNDLDKHMKDARENLYLIIKTTYRFTSNCQFSTVNYQLGSYALIIIGIKSIKVALDCSSSYTGLNTPARVESASSTRTVGVSIFERISTRNDDLKPMVIG